MGVTFYVKDNFRFCEHFVPFCLDIFPQNRVYRKCSETGETNWGRIHSASKVWMLFMLKFWKTQIPSGTVASGRNPTRRTCFGRLGTSFRHSSWDKQGINIPFVGTVETITCWTRHTTTRPPGSSSKFTKKVYACPVSIQLDYVFSLNEGTIFTLMNLKPFQLWHLGEDLRQCCLTLQPQISFTPIYTQTP